MGDTLILLILKDYHTRDRKCIQKAIDYITAYYGSMPNESKARSTDTTYMIAFTSLLQIALLEGAVVITNKYSQRLSIW